jgi:S-DNA-T family DNA segregation ATPase FtsK/SpoIIIE
MIEKKKGSFEDSSKRSALSNSLTSSPSYFQLGAKFFFSLIALISCLSFQSSYWDANWLGALGHSLALVSRFMFGVMAIPIFTYFSFSTFNHLKNPRLQAPYPFLAVAGFICSGLLLNLFAELQPKIAQILAPWAYTQTVKVNHGSGLYFRYNLGGVPLYFFYKDLPSLNLRHILSDSGIALIATTGLMICSYFKLRNFSITRARLNPISTPITPIVNSSSTPLASLEKATSSDDPSQLSFLKQLRDSKISSAISKSISPSSSAESSFNTVSPSSASSRLSENRTSSQKEKVFNEEFKLEKLQDSNVEKSTLSSLSPSALSILKKAKSKLTQLDGSSPYVIPSLELLTAGKKFDAKKGESEITQQSRLLEETLLSFGIEGKVGQVHVGPRLLSFEVHPAIGVKVQRIKALEDDIALNLQARSLRIIAPIPGKAAVGIEVPTRFPQEVNFKEMIQQYQAQPERYAIPIILGKTASGEDVHFDLAKMPHLIIAGATGSGKSVCVNTIIMSILLHATANDIRLLMVDPKKVELTPYSKLPHMIAPVVTEPHQAAEALRWMVVEMERRYEILKRLGLRHIESFNQRQRDENFESSIGIEIPIKMPYIVGIIDELADLMMTSPADIETPIARIAQMARAVGIHLILATQRPSREVITGLIKANFPARIAFKVSSRINSQIILDEVGAEGLLGNGDMLFLHPTKGSLMRAQGAFIRDEDINRVIETIEMQAGPNYLLKADLLGEISLGSEPKSADELYDKAKQLVIDTGTASTTFLQRKLRIGYARAASLMDELEQNRIVGPSEGGKPRRILSIQNDEEIDP